MEPREAALRVLAERAPEELHWTVIWDEALRRGYIDPFAQRDARDQMVRALAAAARSGDVTRTSKGTYAAKQG